MVRALAFHAEVLSSNLPELFQGLYKCRLPQDMRDHLATRQFDSPHQMAETADLLWDARSHGAASAPLMSSELVAAAAM